MLDSFHPGPLPPFASFAEGKPDTIVLSALKLAEDGSGDVIVRCFEASGQPTRGRINLGFLEKVIETQFKPHELKTFRVSADIREVDLLECSN
jgi:alpha-mannosidase